MALESTPGEGGDLRELASGVDALYVSGSGDVDALLPRLEAGRALSEETENPIPFVLGGEEFRIRPRSWGRYRYCLEHRYGQVGLTGSSSLPAVRVQPRSEVLHGLGPTQTVEWFDERLTAEIGPCPLIVSRLDLYVDVQGWLLHGNLRDRFVCRGRRRNTHEDGADWTGFEFGRRTSKTVTGRIYDKGRQVKEKGLDWWPDVWGRAYDPAESVVRVELEVGRVALREFGVEGVGETLAKAPAMWANLTNEWLTFRTPTGDKTKARWPLASEWRAIQRASLRGSAIGIEKDQGRATSGVTEATHAAPGGRPSAVLRAQRHDRPRGRTRTTAG